MVRRRFNRPHRELALSTVLVVNSCFNIIVNPHLAQKYVRHRLFVVGISLPLLGIGAALAISGYFWAGLPLVAMGFLLPRVIKAQAPKILLYLAQHDAKTYFEAMKFGILEVRYR